jgi:hypothetical protein
MSEDELESLKQESRPEAGAPKWTYLVGTIVTVAALLWAIVSFFLKPEEAKKPAGTSTQQSVNVSVPGNGNVVVGAQTGGDVRVERDPAPPGSSHPASASAAAHQ